MLFYLQLQSHVALKNQKVSIVVVCWQRTRYVFTHTWNIRRFFPGAEIVHEYFRLQTSVQSFVWCVSFPSGRIQQMPPSRLQLSGAAIEINVHLIEVVQPDSPMLNASLFANFFQGVMKANKLRLGSEKFFTSSRHETYLWHTPRHWNKLCFVVVANPICYHKYA